MKFLPFLLSHFKRHKLRTALTVLSILVAFVLFAYLAAVAKAFQMGVDVAGADRLVVRHRVSIIQLLPASYEARIEKIEGVEEAMDQTWFNGIYQDPKNFFPSFPVEPDELFTVYPEYAVPEDQKQAWRTTRTGAVVGKQLAERFGWSIGHRIPISSPIWPKKDGSVWELDSVGMYEGLEEGTDNTQLFFRYDYFDESRRFGEGMVGWYIIKVADPDRAEAIATEIDSLFANSPAETKTETEGAFVKAWADQVGNIGAIVTAILTAVFFTILLVAGNTMGQTVRERTAEIGLLKAIGFTGTQVLGLVLLESVAIAAVGGSLGLLVGWLVVSRGDPTGAFPAVYVPTEALVIGIGLVLALGLLTGLLPALHAMRLETVNALRRD